MVKRFASLLSAAAVNYEKIIKKIEAQKYDGLHFDIMNGHFVKRYLRAKNIVASIAIDLDIIITKLHYLKKQEV